jgi:general secretion pathway protein C
METLFKRYFWVLNLLALAAAAWMLATTINEYVGKKVLAVPASELSADGDAVSTAGLVPRSTEADNMSEVLKARRAFNADPPVEEKPVVDEGASEQPEEQPEEEEKEVVECDQLAVNLIGTMIGPQPDLSMATIEADGASKLVRLGTKVLETAEVRDIQRRFIRLDQGGKECVIRLWAEKQVAQAPTRFGPNGRPGAAAPPRATPAVAKPQKTTNYEEGVQKKSETEYELSRAMLDQNLEDLSTLGMQARIVPNYRNGRYEGFKLVGVRPNSLYRAIGIRSGDIIKRINGREINSPNKAIELFEGLKNSSAINLDIERRGQLQTMQYTIK